MTAAPNVGRVLAAGPVIPVLVIDDEDVAIPLARALLAGGIRVLEITLRTSAALGAIGAIANAVPDAIVGVGTVSRPEEFAGAAKAGARFAVSPGVTDDLIAAAGESGLPYLPGVMTPSDVIRARAAGLTALKLFPAEQAGGIAMLRALAGPFPDVRFCPTGGITPETTPSYLALANVACVGGSWLAPQAAVRAGDWETISALAREAAALRPAARPDGEIGQ